MTRISFPESARDELEWRSRPCRTNCTIARNTIIACRLAHLCEALLSCVNIAAIMRVVLIPFRIPRKKHFCTRKQKRTRFVVHIMTSLINYETFNSRPRSHRSSILEFLFCEVGISPKPGRKTFQLSTHSFCHTSGDRSRTFQVATTDSAFPHQGKKILPIF